MPQAIENSSATDYFKQFPKLIDLLCNKRGWLKANAQNTPVFTILFSVIEDYCPMYSLAALEENAGNLDGTYVNSFLEIIPTQSPVEFTKRALKSAIDERLRVGSVLFNILTDRYLIIPSEQGEHHNAASGILESMAMESPELASKSLSSLDITRLFRKCFVRKVKETPCFFGDYHDFKMLSDDRIPPFCLLNLSELDQPQKWVALFDQKSDAKKVVFSKSSLTQKEKLYFDPDQYDIVEYSGITESSDIYYALAFLFEKARKIKMLNTPTPEFEEILSLINGGLDIATLRTIFTVLMTLYFRCEFYEEEKLVNDPGNVRGESRISKIKKDSVHEQLSSIIGLFSITGDITPIRNFSFLPGFYQRLVSKGIVSEEKSSFVLREVAKEQADMCAWFKREMEDYVDYLYPAEIEGMTPEQITMACLITFFCNHAFKAGLSIRLDPSLKFDEATLHPFLEMMATRYTHTKIEFGKTPNSAHTQLARKIAPFLERNHWLDRHGVNLSASDSVHESFKKAAEFFLQHLSFGKPLDAESMRSWKAMGASLFLPVFSMLDNDFTRNSLFSRKQQHVIYIPIDDQIFHAIKKYIQKNNDFPFKKWVIDIDGIDHAQLIELIDLANTVGIDSIVIQSSDWRKRESLRGFFETVKTRQWTTLIRIAREAISEVDKEYQAFTEGNKKHRAEKHSSIGAAVLASLHNPSHQPTQKSLQAPINREMLDKFTRMIANKLAEKSLPLAQNGGLVGVQQEQQEQQQQSVEKESELGYKRSGGMRSQMDEVQEPIVERDTVGTIFVRWFATLKKRNLSLYQFIKKEFSKDEPEQECIAENILLWLFDKLCDAPIAGFTVQAAELLFENVRNFFFSGVNPDNLPRGFKIAKNAENQLIICFDPMQLSEGNQFTVVLHQKSPESLITYSDDYIARSFEPIKSKFTEFSDSEKALLDKFIAKKPAALYQLWDQRGEDQFLIFIRIMQALQKHIGSHAFSILENDFLFHSHDFSLFASDPYFSVFKEMAEKLPKNSLENKLFFKLLQIHMRFVEWEELQKIWTAFQIFLHTMKKLNITLKEDIFDSYTGMNMFVLLERIIMICLKTERDVRQYFVDNMAQYDLGPAGVYAQVILKGEKEIQHPIFWHSAFEGCDLDSLSVDDPEEHVLKLILDHASKKISKQGIDTLLSFWGELIKKDFKEKKSIEKVFLLAMHICERNEGGAFYEEWMTKDGRGTFLIDIFVRNNSDAIILVNQWMTLVSTFPNRKTLNLDALLMILKAHPTNAQRLKNLLENVKEQEEQFFILEMCSIAARKEIALKKEKIASTSAVKDASKAGAAVPKKESVLDQFFEKKSLLAKIFAEISRIEEGVKPDKEIRFLRMFAMKYIFRFDQDSVDVSALKKYRELLTCLSTQRKNDQKSYCARIIKINDYLMSEVGSLSKTIKYEPKYLITIPRVFSAEAKFDECYPPFLQELAAVLESPGSIVAEKSKVEPPSIKQISTVTSLRCITADHAIFSKKEIVSSLLSQFSVLHNDADIGEILEPLLFLLDTIAEKSEGDLVEFCAAVEEKIKGSAPRNLTFLYDITSTFVKGRTANDFPFFMLPVLFQEMHQLTHSTKKEKSTFSDPVKMALDMILKESLYSLSEKKQLMKLVLRLDYWSDASCKAEIEKLSHAVSCYRENDSARSSVLSLLENCRTFSEYQKVMPYCEAITLDASCPDIIRDHWKKTNALYLAQWLEKDATSEFLETLVKIRNHENAVYVMHIIAWSTFSADKKSDDAIADDRKKLTKLFDQLKGLSRESLVLVASYCTELQSVRGNTLRRILKYHKTDALRKSELNKDNHFYSAETKNLVGEHDANLKRILDNMVCTENKVQRKLSSIEKVKIAAMRAKLIESAKDISDLNLDALKAKLLDLQFKQKALLKKPSQSESDYLGELMDMKIAQLAVMFKIMRCTIGIYPNLSQQMAILLSETIDSPCRIFTLDTGEGKSILIALRAALSAMNGDHVDVCTSNLILARRDEKKFSRFFSAVGCKSGVVTAASSKKEYDALNICYSTAGDVSLLNTAALVSENKEKPPENKEKPADDKKNPYVVMLDESDNALMSTTPNRYSISFMEGVDRHVSEAFYKTVYHFYLNEVEKKGIKSVDTPLMDSFAKTLCEFAGGNESQLRFIGMLEFDDLMQWLRAAHAAHHMQNDRFTVRYEVTNAANSQSEKAHVIYPLSPDDNNLLYATFSEGVHQLLAAKIAKENEEKGIPGKVIFPTFTNVVSSRFMTDELFRYYRKIEGFTATNGGELPNNTVVFGIPTNKLSQRVWNKPTVFEDEDDRFKYLVEQLLENIKQKKSVLISCANDNETKRFKEKLEKHPAFQEYAENLLSYTNDSLMSAEAFLDHKRKKEKSEHGQKLAGTIVISACFDRGANAEVEAVVILDVSAKNLRLQKGGRTARNGEAGSVHECYVKTEILALLEKIYPAARDCLSSDENKKISSLIKPSSDEEEAKEPCEIDRSVLDIVSKLIEHHHVVLHQMENEYQKLISQFSDRAIKFISKAEASKQKELLMTLIKQQREIQKEWNALKSNLAGNKKDKISTIKSSIELCALELSSSESLNLAVSHDKSSVKLPMNAQAADLSTSVTHLMLGYLAHTRSVGPLHFSEALKGLVKHVAETIPSFDQNSVMPYANRLMTIAKNAEEPSKLFSELCAEVEPADMKGSLAAALKNNSKDYAPFLSLLKKQPSDFQEMFLQNFLLTLNPENLDYRIKQAISLLRYLELFYQEEKRSEKLQYADHLFVFLCVPTYNWILSYFNERSDKKERNDELLSIDHLLSLTAFVWEITQGQTAKSDEEIQTQRCDLLASLLDLSTVSINDRVQRQLSELHLVFTQDELINMMPAFCAVEKHAMTSGNQRFADAIAILFKLTVNPDNQHGKSDLLKIWSAVRTYVQSPSASLDTVTEIIHFSLLQKGKFVFSLMEKLLGVGALPAMIPAILKNLGSAFSTQPKQRDRRLHAELFLENGARRGFSAIDLGNTHQIAASA